MRVASCAQLQSTSNAKDCPNKTALNSIYDFSVRWELNEWEINTLFLHLYTRSISLVCNWRGSAAPFEPSPKHTFRWFGRIGEIADDVLCILGVQWNDPFTKCILFMYNLLYTIFVLPQTSVWHYDSQFSHLKVQHLREFNTCFNHKTSINASSNWIDIFKTKQEPKQSCSFKIARKSVHYTEFIKLWVSNLIGTVGRLQPGTAVERSFTPVLNY